jgi:hypothetical protein
MKISCMCTFNECHIPEGLVHNDVCNAHEDHYDYDALYDCKVHMGSNTARVASLKLYILRNPLAIPHSQI